MLSAVILFVLVAPLLLLVERVGPEMARVRRDRQRLVTDGAYVLAWAFLLPAASILVSPVVSMVAGHGPRIEVVAAAPFPIQALGAFLTAELAAYGVHRGFHGGGRLWRLHALHHAPEQLDWLSGFRFHPLDAMTEQALPVIAVAWLGFPPGSITVWVVAATVVALSAHANAAVPDGAHTRVVVTPRYHRTHHERAGEGVNFALVLPCVDMLFGTASFAVNERDFGTTTEVPASGFWRQVGWSLSR